MPGFQTLRLTNFKGFPALVVGFRGLTVLTGTNSSGKSSAMQALALLEQSRDQEEPGFALNGPLVSLGEFQDVLYDRVERGAHASRFIGVEIQPKRGRWQRRFGEADSEADFVPHAAGTEWSSDDLPWRRLHYIGADRLGPMLLHQKSHSAVVRNRNVGKLGEYTVHYLLEHANQPVHQEMCLAGHGPTLELQTAAWIDTLSVGTRVYPDDLKGTSSNVLRFSNGATTGFSSGRRHRSTNVGYGLSYSLPVVVACLGASPGDLLMIENPEAHLHPKAQAQLGRLCASAVKAGAQVVVETHSDHVVNAIRVEVGEGRLTPNDVAMYFFDRVTGAGLSEVHQLNMDERGQIAEWPEGFLDEYLHSLLRLSDIASD